MPTALIFAVDSFVGRHVADELRADGYEVVGTSRRGTASHARADITVAVQVSDIVRSTQPDLVVQCAAATHSSEPAELVAVHCAGTVNVLDAVRRHAARCRLIMLGTAAEYGNVPSNALPVPEEHAPAPASLFGASKLAASELARGAAAEFGLSITVVRPFNIVGPGLPQYYAPARLIHRVRHELGAGAILTVENADSTRDFVDVRDVADAIARLAAAPQTPGTCPIFNVATGIETSILDLARYICELAGTCTTEAAGNAPSRSAIGRSSGDARKLRAATGWEPRHDWRESIADLWAATAGADSQRVLAP